MTIILAPKELLTPGVQFQLPEVVCSTPPKIHPDYPTIYERNAAWVREFLPFSDPRELLSLLEKRYPLWDCLVFPTGLAERVFHTSRVTSLMFTVDDVGLLHYALFNEIATNWMANHPFGQAFSTIFDSLKANMPERVYQRYRQSWQDWFGYVIKENGFRKRSEIPDVDTYLSVRRMSVAVRPFVIFVEYVLGIDLTKQIQTDPDFESLIRVVVEHAMLVNDVFSYRSESFMGDYFNIISPLQHVHGHNIQEAIDITCENIREADETLMQLSTHLRRRYASHPQQIQVHAYVDALSLLCAGNLRWHLETCRYHGPGYIWNGLRKGIVTLHPERTIIDPVEEC